MNGARLWTIARLELTQRVRTVAWYVLLGIFALLLIGVTLLSFLAFGGWGTGGAGVFSAVVYVTLLLVLLVSPTLSGNSINGDRDAATLAPLQVTLATTGEILLGKFLAACITGLAFAAVAVPFLVIATLAGGVNGWAVVTSLVVLVVEVGIVAAIGVAISGILARPLFSVAVTYLIVAALSVGSVIGFGLVSTAAGSEFTSKNRSAEYNSNGEIVCKDGGHDCYGDTDQMVCGEWDSYTYRVPRPDRVWWLLSSNPFVILADATPTSFDRHGNPDDLFGWIKTAVRGAQSAPELQSTWDECDPQYLDGAEYRSGPTPEEIIATTVPSWFVGLGVQVLLAALLLWWAWTRTRTPARTLPPGTRIA
ncbi:MAG: ABC transporter [Microbacterium sp. SCN 70-27]|uniref:ABC transporter permease n=1 Tax=unclassified Microbacterium TaxID=2609290 RepID=UPI00086C1286|nr:MULTISPECIES: ABC transporter permease [unclassified Microbacterium]MBN9224390.1 ABC transporter permease [Microbacterium sp.]ODT28432.1 MAG: ABC transporter [Microbacterium sp. SCN 70-27]